MQKYKLPAVLLAAMFILSSGCSYKEIDEQLQGTIQQVQQTLGGSADGQSGVTAGGDAYVYVPPLPEDDIEYKGLGETFSAYRRYNVSTDGFVSDIERGQEGLTYTLKGVTVYDSIDDADIDMYGSLANGVEWIVSNPFILIDIQASYTAPEGGKEEFLADANELSGMYLKSKITQDEADLLRPLLGYFSMVPKEDDPRLDHQHQATLYYIQDGETIDFQVGLFCAQEYIDDKNVFLEVNEIPTGIGEVTGDTTRKLFVLFPEGEG